MLLLLALLLQLVKLPRLMDIFDLIFEDADPAFGLDFGGLSQREVPLQPFEEEEA